MRTNCIRHAMPEEMSACQYCNGTVFGASKSTSERFDYNGEFEKLNLWGDSDGSFSWRHKPKKILKVHAS